LCISKKDIITVIRLLNSKSPLMHPGTISLSATKAHISTLASGRKAHISTLASGRWSYYTDNPCRPDSSVLASVGLSSFDSNLRSLNGISHAHLYSVGACSFATY